MPWLSKQCQNISSFTFDKLQEREKKYGFSEAVSFTNSKKSKFFNLGPKNDWKKILDENFRNKITKVFEKNLKEIYYTSWEIKIY